MPSKKAKKEITIIETVDECTPEEHARRIEHYFNMVANHNADKLPGYVRCEYIPEGNCVVLCFAEERNTKDVC